MKLRIINSNLFLLILILKLANEILTFSNNKKNQLNNYDNEMVSKAFFLLLANII